MHPYASFVFPLLLMFLSATLRRYTLAPPTYNLTFYSECWKYHHAVTTKPVTNIPCRCVQMSCVCPLSAGVCFPAALQWPSHVSLWTSLRGQSSLLSQAALMCPRDSALHAGVPPLRVTGRSACGWAYCNGYQRHAVIPQGVSHTSITDKVIHKLLHIFNETFESAAITCKHLILKVFILKLVFITYSTLIPVSPMTILGE